MRKVAKALVASFFDLSLLSSAAVLAQGQEGRPTLASRSPQCTGWVRTIR